MSRSHDLIVIGAGSAGLSAAKFATQLGAHVALIDRERPGGDCLHFGCVPSKTLLKAAKVAWEMRYADRYGLTPTPVSCLDLGPVNAHVQATVQRVYQFERPEALLAEGIEFHDGGAEFLSRDTIRAGENVLRSGRFILCTGARPAVPRLPGLDRVPYLTYADVFQLPTLPRTLTILGTGPIGVEMAQAFGRLGAQVTVVGRSGRLLGKADPAVQSAVAEILAGEGVTLRLRAGGIERVEASTVGDRISVHTGEGTIVSDALLVALGRVPNVDGLQLDRADVTVSARGVVVDDRLRTSNPRVFACGDVIGGPQFSHYASWQAYTAVRNALLPGSSQGVRVGIPWAVFTDPEVAMVGLTEPDARERYGENVVVVQLPLDRVDRARTEGDTRGMLKVVLHRDGRILGAHVVATRAGEMIQEYVLAMGHNLRFDQLASSIHVYPTYATATQQLAAQFWTTRLLAGLKGRLIHALLRRVRPRVVGEDSETETPPGEA